MSLWRASRESMSLLIQAHRRDTLAWHVLCLVSDTAWEPPDAAKGAVPEHKMYVLIFRSSCLIINIHQRSPPKD